MCIRDRAAWVGLPNVSFPKFDMGAIALIAPVAVVTVIEHIGHLLAVGEIVDKDYRPLLPRSLAGLSLIHIYQERGGYGNYGAF